MFQVHKKPVFALHINPGDVLDVRECKTPNCDLIFAENHLGMRGHVDPKNVSPENIPLHCIFCPDVREFLTETSLQRYIWLSFFLSVSLSFCRSIFLSFCLLVFLSFCLSVICFFVSLCLFLSPTIFPENHLRIQGHFDPKHVSPENIPLHCIFCLDYKKFLTETSLQRHLCKSMSFCLFVFLSLCPSAFLSICLSVFRSICLCVSLALCPSVPLSLPRTTSGSGVT